MHSNAHSNGMDKGLVSRRLRCDPQFQAAEQSTNEDAELDEKSMCVNVILELTGDGKTVTGVRRYTEHQLNHFFQNVWMIFAESDRRKASVAAKK